MPDYLGVQRILSALPPDKLESLAVSCNRERSISSLTVDTIAGVGPGTNLEKFTKLGVVEMSPYSTDTSDLDLNSLRSLLHSWNPVEVQERSLIVQLYWNMIFNSMEVGKEYDRARRVIEVSVKTCASASRTASFALGHVTSLLTKRAYEQTLFLRCLTSTYLMFREQYGKKRKRSQTISESSSLRRSRRT